MRDIPIEELRRAAGDSLPKPQMAEVARFKEENTTVPRVVAASQVCIVYSLKSRSSLRVLQRASGNSTMLAYKKHTADVTSVGFVNSRSNIVASASEKELLVWCIDDKPEIHTYFCCPMNIASFSWVPVANQPPDLLVHIKYEGAGEVALLKSSQLILDSTKTADGKIGNPDGTLIAKPTDLQSLRKNITVEQPLTSAASPILAFNTAKDLIITASLGNIDAPQWAPCDGGKPLTALQVMPNELLLASDGSSVSVWCVSGEPKPLQRLLLNQARCTALHCTATQASIYLAGGKPGTSDVALLSMLPSAGATGVSFYHLESEVTAKNATVVSGTKDEPRLHVDSGFLLSINLFQGAPIVPLIQAPPPQPQLAQTQPFAPPLPNQPPFSQPAVPSTMSPPQPAASTPSTLAPTLSAPRIPPVGVPNTTFGIAPNAELEALREKIEKALGNTSSMIGVSKSVVSKDHHTLVQEALKAQARTLASLAPKGAAAAGAGAPTSAAFDAVIHGITDPVAVALVESIGGAVEEQLRSQLETSLRTVLMRNERKKQRDEAAELRTALDTIVADLMTTVQKTIQEKQGAYASRFIHYVSDVASEGAQAVAALQQLVVQQQAQLNAFTQSGILEEVQRLREEVATLKAQGPGSAAGPAQSDPQLPPETVVNNALLHLEEGEHMTGLNWVLQHDDPSLLVELLCKCSQDVREAMLDGNIPEATWSRIAAVLVSTPKAETLEPTLEWLCDILADKQTLLANDQLVVAVGRFIDAWKANRGLSQSSKNKLRQIVMIIRAANK